MTNPEFVEAEVIDLALARPAMPEITLTNACINYNLTQLKQWAEATCKLYSVSEFDISDPRTYKDAKDARAAINSYIKEIDSKRIAIKNTYNAPYEAFATDVKEVTDLLKEAAGYCDGAVKTIERLEQQRKKEQLQSEYEDFAPLLCASVPLDKLMAGEKWLNRTCDIAKATKELQAKIMRIDADWQTLKSLNLKSFYDVAERAFFDTCGDLTAAINKAKEAEAQQQRIDAMKAAMAPQPAAEPEPEPDPQPAQNQLPEPEGDPEPEPLIRVPEVTWPPESSAKDKTLQYSKPAILEIPSSAPESLPTAEEQLPRVEMKPYVLVMPCVSEQFIQELASFMGLSFVNYQLYQGTLAQAFIAETQRGL